MKARAILVIDYLFDEGGYKQAAAEQEKIEEMLEELIKGNPTVVNSQMKITERRGDTPPNISKMKFRNN